MKTLIVLFISEPWSICSSGAELRSGAENVIKAIQMLGMDESEVSDEEVIIVIKMNMN